MSDGMVGQTPRCFSVTPTPSTVPWEATPIPPPPTVLVSGWAGASWLCLDLGGGLELRPAEKPEVAGARPCHTALG